MTEFVKRQMIIRWLGLILGLSLLAACSYSQAALIAPAATPTLAMAAFVQSNVTSAPTLTLSAEVASVAETAVFTPTATPTAIPTDTPTPTITPTPLHPLSIEYMRRQSYPGSVIAFEQTLEPGVNYSRYIVSYLSEGYKIYALMTVPDGERPLTGWPVVIFNHGYIPPDEYRTTERYVAYVDGFARNGYIVFRSDYRGHGSSEGDPAGGYGSPAYTIDVLNAVTAVKAYPDADPQRMGMWGHSMGGHITLRAMVISNDIKAGVIWAGVVASYPDLFERWRRRTAEETTLTPGPTPTARGWRGSLYQTYGTPEENPEFWASISPNSYVSDLSGPVQLHHGTSDSSVPYEYSEWLFAQIQNAGQPAELYLYEGDNHNIANSFNVAIDRSIQFFDTYVKGE
jgi:alpha-beta hydrolase superfamily lysophospholipase